MPEIAEASDWLGRRSSSAGTMRSRSARAGHVLAYVAATSTARRPLSIGLSAKSKLGVRRGIRGMDEVLRGEPEAAIEYLRAFDAAQPPRSKLGYSAKGSTAHAHFPRGLRRRSAWARRQCSENPNYLDRELHRCRKLRICRVSGESAHAVSRMLQNRPSLDISGIKAAVSRSSPECLAKYEEGLRKAGLPE